MDRRNFIKNAGYSALALTTVKSLLNELSQVKENGATLPAIFAGHGSPMNAIELNEFSRKWQQLGKELPKPKAILCVSAHWQTNGTKVTAMKSPKTIHDFGGFPQELFDKQYPAPGSPEFAKLTMETIKKTHVVPDHEWGLDHGTWSVLCRMFPLANVPVYQLSLDYSKPPRWHYELAQELKSLRKKGVLIVGSGNMVHNLGMMQWTDNTFEWAAEFDSKMKKLIEDRNHDAIIDYEKMGKIATLSIPTNEHYLPLLYVLALQEKNEPLSFFNERTLMGSVSMRSVKLG